MGAPQSAIVIDTDKVGKPRARWQAAGGNARVMMTNLSPLEDQERISEAWQAKAMYFGFHQIPAGWMGSRFLGVFDIRTPEGAAKFQKLVDKLNYPPAIVQNSVDRAGIDTAKIPVKRLAKLSVNLSANEARDVVAGLLRDADKLGLDRNRLAPMVKNPAQTQIYIQRLALEAAFRSPGIANFFTEKVLSGESAAFTSIISDAAKAAMAMRIRKNESFADALGKVLGKIREYFTGEIQFQTAVMRVAEQEEAAGDFAPPREIATRLAELIEYRPGLTKKGKQFFDAEATADNWNDYLAFLTIGISRWTPDDMLESPDTLTEAVAEINDLHRRMTDPNAEVTLRDRGQSGIRPGRIRELEAKRRRESLIKWEMEELTQLQVAQGDDFMHFFRGAQAEFGLERTTGGQGLAPAPRVPTPTPKPPSEKRRKRKGLDQKKFAADWRKMEAEMEARGCMNGF